MSETKQWWIDHGSMTDCNTMQMFTHLQCKVQRKTEECQKRKTSQEERMKLQLAEKQLEQC